MCRVAALAIVVTTPFAAFTADWKPQIPKTWDDAEIARHEVPLADPAGSPKHVSADYYYRIPVRPIYKSYPVYEPGHEPPGYLDHLKQLEPVILWDDKGHAPPLKTEADWIRAGELVFDSALSYRTTGQIESLRNPAWYKTLGIPVAKDGTVPEYHYVIRTRGTVEVGATSCANCHTRIMPDGSVLKAAQSNYPVNQAAAYAFRQAAAAARDKEKYLADLRGQVKDLHGAPWLKPDMEARIDSMSVDEIASVFEASPPGASLRHRSNSFLPIQVPDLIGLKERRYFDRTGLEVHRDIGDLMRYAAMNQGADRLAKLRGFRTGRYSAIHAIASTGEPQSIQRRTAIRALALAVFARAAARIPTRSMRWPLAGRQSSSAKGAERAIPLRVYSNNKLTPAKGFQIPPEHMKVYDILPISVGTDPALTMRTRRGTGYYKVPSFKGVWYRGMFPHDGSCATLEDWFDPQRLTGRLRPDRFQRLSGREAGRTRSRVRIEPGAGGQTGSDCVPEDSLISRRSDHDCANAGSPCV